MACFAPNPRAVNAASSVSPRHNLTLPEMAVEDIAHVVDVWADQFNELGANIAGVQIFENKAKSWAAQSASARPGLGRQFPAPVCGAGRPQPEAVP